MALHSNKLSVVDFLYGLLSRCDWVYLLSLLVPLAIYNLTLKIISVASLSGSHQLVGTLDLILSDAFFNTGYILFWIGLLAIVRRGLWRRAVVVLLHIVTMLVVLVTTCSHQYFQETGTTLDYGTLAEWIPKFEEIKPILFQGGVPFLAWALLFVTLLYAALGPWLLTRFVQRWRGWAAGRSLAGTPRRISFLGALGLFSLALGFGSLSLLSGTTALARDPFVNLVVTGAKEVSTKEDDWYTAKSTTEHPAAYASLAQTSQTEKRNVVLVHLESTRVGATTPYNADLNTTPFLNELAKNSFLVERAYSIVPHSSKASVSVNCGIEPHLVQPTTEAHADGIPAQCLPALLEEQGYDTVFFQSSTQNFENFGGLVENFGYEEYYPLESMDTEGFEQTNYFSYEDDIMLKPSENWLEEHKTKPFMVEYLMGTGHHDYRCLGTQYGSEDFSEDDLVNRYLNCIRLQDIFLKNLFEQYKRLGLYEDTIFVLFGDHGEGFGEHGRFQHDDTIWEEGIRVPLIIHDPKRFEDGEQVDGLSNYTDILPTLVDLLGYKVENGEYPGYSLLNPVPEDRILRFSCFHKDKCLASIQGKEKYIYHYDNQPEEVFDLFKDPLEEQNLAGERSKEELHKRREDLLIWRSTVNAKYGSE